MDFNKYLTIGYAGTLGYYHPDSENKTLKFLGKLGNYFWTYNHNYVDKSTRSAYYLFKALKILLEKEPNYADTIRVNLWGNIHSGNQKQVSALGLSNIVNISSHLPKEESFRKLKSCDLLFLPLEHGKNGKETLFIPGKLYELLEIGKPILALVENSDCKQIIERSGLGIFAPPDDPEKISEMLIYCIKNKEKINENCRPNSEYIKKFAFSELTINLKCYFDDLLSN